MAVTGALVLVLVLVVVVEEGGGGTSRAEPLGRALLAAPPGPLMAGIFLAPVPPPAFLVLVFSVRVANSSMSSSNWMGRCQTVQMRRTRRRRGQRSSMV
jgi:hypothetical protein